MSNSRRFTVRNAERTDVQACADVYNYWIENSVYTFDESTWTSAEAEMWLAAHQDHEGYPLLVIEADGVVRGWGSLSPWSDKLGYRFTAEVSVFADPEWRGRGLGRDLMGTLMKRAEQHNHHALLARVESSNRSSIQLFRKFGFDHTGLMREVGYKNGRWLDVALMQKTLRTSPDD